MTDVIKRLVFTGSEPRREVVMSRDRGPDGGIIGYRIAVLSGGVLRYSNSYAYRYQAEAVYQSLAAEE